MVKKTNLTRATAAGAQSNNVIEFLRQAHDSKTLTQDKEDIAHRKMMDAAGKARAQLKNLKIKTPVIVEEVEEPEEKEGGGEEGEEGAAE